VTVINHIEIPLPPQVDLRAIARRLRYHGCTTRSTALPGCYCRAVGGGFAMLLYRNRIEVEGDISAAAAVLQYAGVR
jgi:hypothetical protein